MSDFELSAGIRHLVRCASKLDDVISRVPESAWESPTCCEGWSVRDCASHAIGVLVNFRARAIGADVVDINDGSWAGSNPSESSKYHLARLLEALPQVKPDDLFTHPLLGELSFDDFYGSLAYDSLIHAWDIADGAAIDHRIDEETAKEASERSGHLVHLVRSDDYVFNPACGDDTLSRLVESTGRTPVRGW